MKIALVLSSGRPLLTLEVQLTSTIQALKQLLRRTLISQAEGIVYFRTPDDEVFDLPVWRFRNPSNHNEHELYANMLSYEVQLFEYRGDRLRDGEMVSKVVSPICVLRPTDIVTTCCSVQGKQGVTVFNVKKEVVWAKDEDLASEDGAVIELVFISAQKEVFLCSALATDTVQTLQTRLGPLTSFPPETMTLWYRDTPLTGSLTLQDCGLRNRSRISLQLSMETVSLVRDRHGRVAVLPMFGDAQAEALSKKVALLESEWSKRVTIREVICTCSSSSSYFHRLYLVCALWHRVEALQFSDGHSEKVVIPDKCTVHEVKYCIEVQHGLRATSISLTLLSEQYGSSWGKTGVEDGDKLVLVKETELAAQRRNISTVPRNCARTNTVTPLKQKTEALPCEIEAEMLLKGQKLPQFGLISPRIRHTAYTEPEHSLELFDIGQDPNKLSHTERLLRYEREILQTIPVRLIIPNSAFYLNVHKQATVERLKAHISERLKVCIFKVMQGDEELEDAETLEQQGVQAGSDLLVVLPNSWKVAVTIPSGKRFLVVLEPNATVNCLKCVLERLTGLAVGSQRLLSLKVLSEKQAFPVVWREEQVFIKIGTS